MNIRQKLAQDFVKTDRSFIVMTRIAKYGAASEAEIADALAAEGFIARARFRDEMREIIAAGYATRIKTSAGDGYAMTEDGALYLATEHGMDWALAPGRLTYAA